LFAVLIPALRLQDQVARLLGFEADDEIGDVIMSIPVIADVRDGKTESLIFDEGRGAGVVVEDVGRVGFSGVVGDDVVDMGVQHLTDGFAGPEVDVVGGADRAVGVVKGDLGGFALSGIGLDGVGELVDDEAPIGGQEDINAFGGRGRVDLVAEVAIADLP